MTDASYPDFTSAFGARLTWRDSLPVSSRLKMTLSCPTGQRSSLKISTFAERKAIMVLTKPIGGPLPDHFIGCGQFRFRNDAGAQFPLRKLLAKKPPARRPSFAFPKADDQTGRVLV